MILQLPFSVRRQLANNEFAFDFFEGELRQCVEEKPVVFRGPGTISQTADGRLQIKLLHTYASLDEWAHEGNMASTHAWGEAGQIVNSSGYFAFTCKAVDGTEWRSERVSVTPDFGIAQVGRPVIGRTAELFTVRSGRPEDAKVVNGFRLVCPGKYYLHWADDKTVDGKACKRQVLSLDTGTCTLHRFDDCLNIDVELPGEGDVETAAKRVIKALGFALGAYLHPVALLTESAAHQKLRLFNRDSKAEQARVSSPVHFNWSDDIECSQQLIDLIVASSDDKVSDFYAQWYRVAHSWGGDAEIQALVVSVAVEGVMKAFFQHLYPADPEASKALADAIPAIEALDIEPTVKKRIVGWMGKTSPPSIHNGLHALVEQQVITKELVDKWKFLRHRSAHGGDLLVGHEPQLVIDAVYACLELFYRLALKSVGYEGAMQQFSVHGWPRVELALPSPVDPRADLLDPDEDAQASSA